MAAFLVASSLVEDGRLEEALPVLDKGLALQPTHPMLTVEKATVLVTLKRPAESLALIEATSAGGGLEVAFFQARLLRAKGIALIDLNRLDEAEAAFKASLKIEPNHPTAKHELNYIKQLRRGGKALPVGPVSGFEQEAKKAAGRQ